MSNQLYNMLPDARASKRIFWAVLTAALLIGGGAFYLTPRLVPATPLSNLSDEPRSLADLVNFTKISNLKESTLTPLSTDWESALATIQQYQGTASIYSDACSKYSCPGGVPITLASTPQTILPQRAVPPSGDSFGYSVAAVGTNLLIGVPFNTTSGLSSAGAAYLFDGSGNLLRTYREPTSGIGDYFGASVASLGSNVLIGASGATVGGFGGAGAAYLFDSTGNLLATYHEPAPGASDFFGASAANVGGDILIGSYGTTIGALGSAGAAYLFDGIGDLLATYHEPATATNDNFGYSVAGVGGNILIGSPHTIVGASASAGATYLFDSSGNLLRTYHEPTPAVSDFFGASVASVGGNVLIGSSQTSPGGAAYLFDNNGNLLRTYRDPPAGSNDFFGASVASVGGNILIGSYGTGQVVSVGAAYLFDNSGNLLATYHEPSPASGDNFGWSVAGVGGNILIGSKGAGAAYLFDSGGNLLRTFHKMTRPINGQFGSSVAGVGSNLVVGAPGDSNNAGIVYVLDSTGTIIRTLRKPVPVAGDYFGNSLAAAGSNIAVGTPNDSTIGPSAGAVYIYDTSGNLLTTLRKPGAAANDQFGLSVTAVGTNILVGVPGNGTLGLPNMGAAYLFDNSGNLLTTYHEPPLLKVTTSGGLWPVWPVIS